MIMLELIAKKYKMEYVMLTTFKSNKRALAFYIDKMKYVLMFISYMYVIFHIYIVDMYKVYIVKTYVDIHVYVICFI
jgi:hypothetical protein